jgi:hypothetical protein
MARAARFHGIGPQLTARIAAPRLRAYAMPSPVCPLAKYGGTIKLETYPAIITTLTARY